MTTERARPNYVAVWVWLVVLMIAGVLASYLPFTKSAVIFLIFVVAAMKALLVALYYMHLRFESGLIYAMVIVPVVLVIGLTFLLFPDLVFHH
jgi:cytochrome c oxidase subunit 4